MPRYYAGIGSRQTPGDVLLLMEGLAEKLAGEGWMLRSGHAAGADRAFERGANGNATIYLPWPSFGTARYGDDEGMRVVGEAVVNEPQWRANFEWLVAAGLYPQTRTNSVRLLHGRNVAQVRGHDCPHYASPCKFVICWCPEPSGVPQGGTATAVKLARHLGIEVRNLWHDEVLAAAHTWLAR